MPVIAKFTLDISDITDVSTAIILLTDLHEKGKWQNMEGYRPFKLVDYTPEGGLRIECHYRHAKPVKAFVREYLSREAPAGNAYVNRP